MENEIPKYKKISLKATTKKSKHKHLYGQCLLIDVSKNVSRANYCVECGNIGDIFMFESIDAGNGYNRMLNSEEVLDKYKDLPKKLVDDIFKTNNISLL
jgi:hypothetical protein